MARAWDGSADQASAALTLGVSGITVCCWLRYTGTWADSANRVFYEYSTNYNSGSTNDVRFIAFKTSGNVLHVIAKGGEGYNGSQYNAATVAIDDGAWHHVAFRYNIGDSQVAHYWEDGVQLTRDSSAGGTAAITTTFGNQTVFVGSRSGSLRAPIDLANIHVYTTALTDAEVKNDYRRGRAAAKIPAYSWRVTGNNDPEPALTGGVSLTLTSAPPKTDAPSQLRWWPKARFWPYITAAGGVTVTPTTASLTLATFAPTVSTPRLVTPGVASLSLSTFAPTVTVGAVPGPRVGTWMTYGFGR